MTQDQDAETVARLDALERRTGHNAQRGRKGWVPVPLFERFERYAVRPAAGESANKCWGWSTRSIASNGYPYLSCNGRKRRASHVAWEWKHKRPFPAGMHACHSCDNPSCVNPDHIWPGTNADNIRDAHIKGRHSSFLEKTHCIRGHEFTPENSQPTKGGRGCRQCARDRRHTHYAAENAKRRAARAALQPGAPDDGETK